MNRPLDEQYELISRGAEEIIPEQELRGKIENSIKNDKPLIIDYKIDINISAERKEKLVESINKIIN